MEISDNMVADSIISTLQNKYSPLQETIHNICKNSTSPFSPIPHDVHHIIITQE